MIWTIVHMIHAFFQIVLFVRCCCIFVFSWKITECTWSAEQLSAPPWYQGPPKYQPTKERPGSSTPPPLTDDKPTWLKSQDTFYLFCACDSRMNEDALFHIFSNFVYFCQNFQILCLFLPFFLNMAYMRLFFRIGPASSKIFSNTVGSKVL